MTSQVHRQRLLLSKQPINSTVQANNKPKHAD